MKSEKPTNWQQLNMATVKAWQSIFKDENQILVKSMGSRHQTVIDANDFHPNINAIVIFSIIFASPKKRSKFGKFHTFVPHLKFKLKVHTLHLLLFYFKSNVWMYGKR